MSTEKEAKLKALQLTLDKLEKEHAIATAGTLADQGRTAEALELADLYKDRLGEQVAGLSELILILVMRCLGMSGDTARF